MSDPGGKCVLQYSRVRSRPAQHGLYISATGNVSLLGTSLVNSCGMLRGWADKNKNISYSWDRELQHLPPCPYIQTWVFLPQSNVMTKWLFAAITLCPNQTFMAPRAMIIRANHIRQEPRTLAIRSREESRSLYHTIRIRQLWKTRSPLFFSFWLRVGEISCRQGAPV